MSNSAIEGLKPELVWDYFYQITQIPRPSKKEEKVRKWVKDFASQHNFSFEEDETGNIVIRVPATEGYEDKPTVVLQGHIDMVCEKNNDKVHDFENDPLTIKRDGDWITADGTTLGADNGIGVAAAMAIATDTNSIHGPLELLLTVDEETGMTGAMGLKPGFITGSVLLNLDSEEDGAFYVGCSGGIDTMGKFSVNFSDEIPENYHPYKIEVTGLKGGHSGLDIHRGRANAIKLLAYFLNNLESDFLIYNIDGGSLRNAIPREASVEILIPESSINSVKEKITEFEKNVNTEYRGKEEKIEIRFEKLENSPSKTFSKDFSEIIIKTLTALPHGVISMSASLENLVETSTNLATVKINGETLIIGTSQRSSIDFAKENIAATVASVLSLAGAEVVSGDGYPGWQPNMDSQILKLSKSVYKKNFGAEPEIKAIHAGLECGLLSSKYPGVDMISFGPTIEGAHSPTERVNIKAVEKFYELLKNILKEIVS